MDKKTRKIEITLSGREDMNLGLVEERLRFVLESLQRSLLADGTARMVKMEIVSTADKKKR